MFKAPNTIQEGEAMSAFEYVAKKSRAGSAKVRRKMSSPLFLWSKMYAIPTRASPSTGT